MAMDASRIFVQEGAYPFRKDRLDYVLQEISAGLYKANTFPSIIRNGTTNLIERTKHWTDITRTVLNHECIYTRTIGVDGVSYVTGMTAIFYEADGTTEDSRVTVTMVRDGSDRITSCDAVFSTSEDTKL